MNECVLVLCHRDPWQQLTSVFPSSQIELIEKICVPEGVYHNISLNEECNAISK